jgi:hypothetical protein
MQQISATTMQHISAGLRHPNPAAEHTHTRLCQTYIQASVLPGMKQITQYSGTVTVPTTGGIIIIITRLASK